MAHPQVLALTLESLRYYVNVLKVDGFRFDLGPTLGRNPNDYDPNAPFFKAIADCPIQYRDTVRSFWKGDPNAHQSLAGKLLASAETFENPDKKSARPPQTSVNFIAAHDGFTLRDTVSYNHKHNMANGEDNRDGHSHNLSDNMGAEGPTDNEGINRARQQRQKNMLATLMLSQGVPMMLGGDEFGQSMQGNNNAYCQDNDITWLNWAEADEALMAFTKDLISLRKSYPHFRQAEFLHGETLAENGIPNVQWLSPSGEILHTHEWENAHLACFAMALSLPNEDSLIIVFNRGEACEFNFSEACLTTLMSTCGHTHSPNHIAPHSVTVLWSHRKLSRFERAHASNRGGNARRYIEGYGRIHFRCRQQHCRFGHSLGSRH